MVDSGPVNPRRLCVFFSAAGIRYAIDAGAVLEVARPGPDDDTLRGHLGLRDFSQLFGGVQPLLDRAALVFDTSPTLAARVDEVDGIFDAAAALPLRWTPRAADHFSPRVKHGFIYEGALFFELSVTGLLEPAPRASRPLAVVPQSTGSACLWFTSGAVTFAIPLSHVRHVVARGPTFNPCAPMGSLRGALAWQDQLLAVYTLSESDRAEAFLIVAETGEHQLALSAEVVHGVKPPQGPATVVDLAHTFS